MAKLIVTGNPIIKCHKCSAIYMPEVFHAGDFEACPVCGYNYNSKTEIISPFEYKWLRFWRNFKGGEFYGKLNSSAR